MATELRTCSKCRLTKEFKIYTSSRKGYCVECSRAYCREWRKNHKDRVKQSSHDWEINNRERRRFLSRKWLEENPEYRTQRLLTCKEWRKNNAERYALGIRLCRLRNPQKYKAIRVACDVRHKIEKLNRCPRWLSQQDRDIMGCMYEIAQAHNEKYTGRWEVDHIVPLRGKLVSGLHVPWNLQILTQRENRRKGNRFEVE